MWIRSLKFAIGSLALVALTGQAHAQTETPQSMGFVGLKGGLAAPTNLNNRLGYGIDAGMNLGTGITGILYFLNSQNGSDPRLTHYGLGVDYSLNAWLPNGLNGFHGGARVGAGYVTGPTNHTDLSVGADLGYDYYLMSYLSVGAEADMFWNLAHNRELETFYGLINLRYYF